MWFSYSKESLTPSLSQPVQFPGWKIHGRAYKQCIFRSYIYSQCCPFWWKSFHMPERKRKQGFQISHFYGSFSSDNLAGKGLTRVRERLFTTNIYYLLIFLLLTWGAWIAQWLERRTHDRKVPGSSPGRRGGRIFFSRVNFLCWLLFRYQFHPSVTAVARKRPRSFCQKCRWQVTAKDAYTLPMWLWMKWHCKLVHGWMAYKEPAPKRQHFTWHQPCNTQRALPVHHFRGY